MSVPSTPVNLASLRESVGLILENHVPEIKQVLRYTTSSQFFADMPYAYMRVTNLQYSALDTPWGPMGATDCIVTFGIFIVGRMDPSGDNVADESLSDTIAAKLRPAFESDPLLSATGTALAVNSALESVDIGLVPENQDDSKPLWAIQATVTALVTT